MPRRSTRPGRRALCGFSPNSKKQPIASAGLTPLQVLCTADLAVDYVNGFALTEGSGRLGQPGERREFLELLRNRPAAEFPAMHRVFQSLPAGELRADFEGGPQVILAGIKALCKKYVKYT